eukprot:EG_transcript_25766
MDAIQEQGIQLRKEVVGSGLTFVSTCLPGFCLQPPPDLSFQAFYALLPLRPGGEKEPSPPPDHSTGAESKFRPSTPLGKKMGRPGDENSPTSWHQPEGGGTARGKLAAGGGTNLESAC